MGLITLALRKKFKSGFNIQKSDVETKILLLNSAGSASFPHGGCPQDLGPYTDCFDRRLTNFGCYCFVKTQVKACLTICLNTTKYAGKNDQFPSIILFLSSHNVLFLDLKTSKFCVS